MPHQNRKAAVFIILGQSNATGHGIPMEEKDRITTPLHNVFGLSREANQSLDVEKLTWSGYTSGGMNLGEEQDHTYSVPNCLAAAWQEAVDSGRFPGLPDLYIVHIAIGAQGVTGAYMWNPNYPLRLIPGRLGIADISLYPFTLRILSLLRESFDAMGLEMDVMGVHWRGGEEDLEIPIPELEPILPGIYDTILTGFREAVGGDCPLILHRIICGQRADDLDPTGQYRKNMEYINSVYEEKTRTLPDCALFDPRRAPQYTDEPPCNGIFIDDHVHFTPAVNRWVAESIMERYASRRGRI